MSASRTHAPVKRERAEYYVLLACICRTTSYLLSAITPALTADNPFRRTRCHVTDWGSLQMARLTRD